MRPKTNDKLSVNIDHVYCTLCKALRHYIDLSYQMHSFKV